MGRGRALQLLPEGAACERTGRGWNPEGAGQTDGELDGVVWTRVSVIPGKQLLRHAQVFRDSSGEEARSQGTLGLFPVEEGANGERAARDRGILGRLGGVTPAVRGCWGPGRSRGSFGTRVCGESSGQNDHSASYRVPVRERRRQEISLLL